MSSLLAFMKKEITEHLRSGRLLILCILFVLLGIMNPAVAKLTPWMMEIMADSLAETGIIITEVTVTAMDSWVQFFKNIPMGLIAFVLLESGIFTKEYTSGTLVLSLTKGLSRYKVVIAKTAVLTVLWSACYWLCFGITYGYNAYFWDNSIAQNLIVSVVFWWLFGLAVVMLVVLFSTLSKSNTGVLCGTASVILGCYLVGFLPKCGKFLPTYLADGNSLIYGMKEPDTYVPSLLITVAICIVSLIISIPLFDKKQL